MNWDADCSTYSYTQSTLKFSKWYFSMHQSLEVANCCIMALLVWNLTYVTQILCHLSYKAWSTFITKFGTIELFTLILDTSAFMYQVIHFCHATSKSGLLGFCRNHEVTQIFW